MASDEQQRPAARFPRDVFFIKLLRLQLGFYGAMMSLSADVIQRLSCDLFLLLHFPQDLFPRKVSQFRLLVWIIITTDWKQLFWNEQIDTVGRRSLNCCLQFVSQQWICLCGSVLTPFDSDNLFVTKTFILNQFYWIWIGICQKLLETLKMIFFPSRTLWTWRRFLSFILYDVVTSHYKPLQAKSTFFFQHTSR